MRVWFGGPSRASLRILHLEDSLTMRELVRNLLQDMGFDQPIPCDTATAALRVLAAGRVDVILSDFDLGEGPDGQSFLEKIRRERLVPRDTIFMMLTAERTYARVAQIVELAPDDYLVKPFAARTLELRLFAQLARVEVLRPALAALDAGDLPEALSLARAIARAEGPHQREALRLAVEALVGMERFDEAMALVERLVETPLGPQPPRWALLEIARIQRRRGNRAEAREAFERVLEHYPHYVVPRDALYEMAMEDDDLRGAQTWLDRAIEVSRTPARCRKLGELMLLLDRPASAERAFADAIERGRYSFFRDATDFAMAAHAALAAGSRARASRYVTEGLRQLEQTDASRVLLPLESAAAGELPDRMADEVSQGLLALGRMPASFSFPPIVEVVLADYLLRFDAFREAHSRLGRSIASVRPGSALHRHVAALHERARHDLHHYEVWGMTVAEKERRRIAREAAAVEKNNEAVARLKAGKIDEAIELVEVALGDDPEHETLLANAASMRLTRFNAKRDGADLDAAVAHLERASAAGHGGEDFDSLRRRIDLALSTRARGPDGRTRRAQGGG